jgi:hypothetical protein
MYTMGKTAVIIACLWLRKTKEELWIRVANSRWYCDMGGRHSDVEDSKPVGYYGVSTSKEVTTSRKSVVPPNLGQADQEESETEAFGLLGCYAAYVGSCLTTHWQHTLRNISKEWRPQLHRSGRLKSHKSL